MDAVSWNSGMDGAVSNASTEGVLVDSALTRSGFASSSSLVLDNERGELVEAPIKFERKGVSSERSASALKNHSEAERRRRARINAHLDSLRTVIPGANKTMPKRKGLSSKAQMDKASLLAEVIKHLKELKREAAQTCNGFLIPKDTDEIKVELLDQQEYGWDGIPYAIRAYLCCEYKPGLLSDIKQALDSLHLMIMRAEVATLGSRMENIFLLTSCLTQHREVNETSQLLVSSVDKALKSVLDRFSTSHDFLGRTNKRSRISILNSNTQSFGDFW